MTSSYPNALGLQLLMTLAGCAAAALDDGEAGPSEPLQPGVLAATATASAATSASSEPYAPEIAPLQLETWADASNSPAKRIDPPGSTCIADAGGCTFGPMTLPPCPADQPFVDISSPEVMRALDGKATVLRGTVWDQKLYELVGCYVLPASANKRCCAPESPAPLYLGTFGVGPGKHARAPALILSDPVNPNAYACQRDETARCCGLETETNVLAYGFVRHSGMILERPHLCKFTQ
jgi:hypothetical protein